MMAVTGAGHRVCGLLAANSYFFLSLSLWRPAPSNPASHSYLLRAMDCCYVCDVMHTVPAAARPRTKLWCAVKSGSVCVCSSRPVLLFTKLAIDALVCYDAMPPPGSDAAGQTRGSACADGLATQAPATPCSRIRRPTASPLVVIDQISISIGPTSCDEGCDQPASQIAAGGWEVPSVSGSSPVCPLPPSLLLLQRTPCCAISHQEPTFSFRVLSFSWRSLSRWVWAWCGSSQPRPKKICGGHGGGVCLWRPAVQGLRQRLRSLAGSRQGSAPIHAHRAIH
jgi:hypothetical protein